MDDVFLAMKRDYLGIVGGNVGQITMPKEERMVRRAVDDAIGAADESFRGVMDADLEGLNTMFPSSGNDETVVEGMNDDPMATDDEDDDNDDEDDGGEAGDAAQVQEANDTDMFVENATDENEDIAARTSSEAYS